MGLVHKMQESGGGGCVAFLRCVSVTDPYTDRGRRSHALYLQGFPTMHMSPSRQGMLGVVVVQQLDSTAWVSMEPAPLSVVLNVKPGSERGAPETWRRIREHSRAVNPSHPHRNAARPPHHPVYF